MLLLDKHLCRLTLVEITLFEGFDHVCHLLIFVLKSFISLLERFDESLEVESVNISRVLALTDSHELLDLVNFT